MTPQKCLLYRDIARGSLWIAEESAKKIKIFPMKGLFCIFTERTCILKKSKFQRIDIKKYSFFKKLKQLMINYSFWLVCCYQDYCIWSHSFGEYKN